MNISTAVSNSKSRLTQWETWTWGLLNATLMGAAGAGLSWTGMAAAHGAGMDVPMLNFKSLGIILLSGALPKFFSYLSAGLPSLTQTVSTSSTEPDGTKYAQEISTTITPLPTGTGSGLTSGTGDGTIKT